MTEHNIDDIIGEKVPGCKFQKQFNYLGIKPPQYHTEGCGECAECTADSENEKCLGFQRAINGIQIKTEYEL